MNKTSLYLDIPNYLLIGSFGGLVGHEIFHSFYLTENESDFWMVDTSPEARLLYSEKESCLSLQYSTIFQRNVSLNNGSIVLLKVMQLFKESNQ